VSQIGAVEAPAPAKPVRRTNIPLGIFCMVGATILFAGSSAAAKWYVATYPFGEVLFMRQIASFVTCAVVMVPFTGLSVFRTRRLPAHGMRAVSQTISQTLIIVAFSLMPLGSAVAINFSAPLFATLASAIFLREHVGAVRWTALIVGLVGVLVITNPGAATFQVGALFALGNAILYGSVTAGVRGMTATESTETLIVYQMVLLTIAYTFFLPFGFLTPTLADGIAMLVLGVANFFAQYLWTRALHLAPASAVTPFYYFSLVWAMALGFAIWGDIPTPALVAGSTIVVATGLFLLWHETSRRSLPER
jgi:drug/metabolite transporter (DMT)-like permease